MNVEMMAAFTSLIPPRGAGRAEEIASVARLLASDDLIYVNGLGLVTDGGASVI